MIGDTFAMSERNAVLSDPGSIPIATFDSTGKHLSAKSKEETDESPKNRIAE